MMRATWGGYVSSSGVTEATWQLQQHAFLCFCAPISASLIIWAASNLKILTLIRPLFGGSLDLGLWAVFFVTSRFSICPILYRGKLRLCWRRNRVTMDSVSPTHRGSMEEDWRKGTKRSDELEGSGFKWGPSQWWSERFTECEQAPLGFKLSGSGVDEPILS